MHPEEKEAVRTTIVGGRPPGSGKDNGAVPQGIEVLVKKAAVDAEFRALLLEARADAARAIELELTPSEAAMLEAVPAAQLEAIIARTRVHRKVMPALLGHSAAAMLVALSAVAVVATGCDSDGERVTRGVQPDRPEPTVESVEPNQPAAPDAKPADKPTPPPVPQGIRPDQPPPSTTVEPDAEPPQVAPQPEPKPEPPSITRGISPDRPPVTKGIRPDRPPATLGIQPDQPKSQSR